MAQIYESLRLLVTSAMITKAAQTLGEDTSKISAGVSALMPSLLGRMIALGDNKHVEEVVRDAGKVGLLGHLKEVFEGKGIIEHKNFGERMENALIGSVNKEFIRSVSSSSGLKYENADRLSNWVSAAIAGFIGDHMVEENMSYKQILGLLDKEKEEIKQGIPAASFSALGLSSALGGRQMDKLKEVSKPG